MRRVCGLVAGIVIALSLFMPAMAHEEDTHPGELHVSIPLIAAWIGGAAVVLIFLLFFMSWMNSRRTRPQQHGDKEREGLNQQGEPDDR